ncbi:MAG: ABC transporter ATP-binding protein [Proteobacteria bacterium]|nr:ABC transporter ATP-binding protein [Pseudomonadota bacterium]
MRKAVQDSTPGPPILQVDGLNIEYRAAHHTSVAARDVTFSIRRGEVFGLVGETGSGKSTVLRSIIGLLHEKARVAGGAIRVAGREVTCLDGAALADLRRKHVAMIFQDPLRALNPVMTIGAQLAEVLQAAGLRDRAEINRRVLDALGQVGIADPEIRMRAYPHELSGGQRQRVAIAAAMIRSPELILADEPTTALDVTIQDQILTLLYDLCREKGMSVLLVTHDLGVVAEVCDRVGVLYAGRLVETGSVTQVLSAPSHPYTAALLGSMPRRGERQERLRVIPGRPPDFPIEGCPFAPRCAHALPECGTITPVLKMHDADQASACWRHDQLRTRLAEEAAVG